tara:strand:- start:268 stop:492 length:225 start_codon:yes stop_codon:yes gene_type:complete
MIKVIAILLILTSPLTAEENCKYSAEGEVLNQTIINLKETYVCKEEPSFLYSFFTEDAWSKTATMTILFIMENL